MIRRALLACSLFWCLVIAAIAMLSPSKPDGFQVSSQVNRWGVIEEHSDHVRIRTYIRTAEGVELEQDYKVYPKAEGERVPGYNSH